MINIVIAAGVIIAVLAAIAFSKAQRTGSENHAGLRHVHFKDMVCKNETGRLGYLMRLMMEHPDAIAVAWFADTQKQLNTFFEEKNIEGRQVLHVQDITAEQVQRRTVIFVERHPLFSKEQKFCIGMKAGLVVRLCTLDDELIKMFGSENLKPLMERMGFGEEEALEHSMISKSIEQAQQKLEQAVKIEKPATSPQQWFRLNAEGFKP
jgi:hypothetical protein